MENKLQYQQSPLPHKKNIRRLFETIDQTYEVTSQRLRKNPELSNIQYLKSKREELHSVSSHKQDPFFTKGDPSYRSIDELKKQRVKTENRVKLPIINTKSPINQNFSPYEKLNSRHSYLSPTVNSTLNQKSKQTKGKKRICSVNCLAPHRRKKTENRHVETPMLRQFLAAEAKASYPETQLNRYLSRMRITQEQKTSDKKYVYQTFFGIQPQFYRLQTQYSKQINQNLDVSPLVVPDKTRAEIPCIPNQEYLPDFMQGYNPYNQEIDMEKLFASPRFIVEYSRSELFFGQMIGNSKEGKGILLRDKKIFEGLFRGNSKVKGLEINASGVYKGQFFNEKRCGSGQFEWQNGQYYIGQWQDGVRHGKGVWTNKCGDSYNGDWVKGKGEGHGVYIVGGQQYRGNFVDFKKHGWGKEKFFNGDIYEGVFCKGLPEGKGKYTWINGTRYQGQFLAGIRNGKGILKTPDKFCYKGEFVDEKPEGLCEIFMPNGDIYSGYLHDGKKNGRGTLILQDSGKILDGIWSEDNFISAFAS